MSLLSQLTQSQYYRNNKPFILLLFAWLFRLNFLMQRNDGGVSLNKYVLLQIALIMGIFYKLNKIRMYPTELLQYSATRIFCIIYIMGMLSMLWSVFPLMSCYFAFENLVCMTVLLHLALQCENEGQLERVFVWLVIGIIGMFVLRNITLGGGWHSVTFSTVSGMLLTYCLGEYNANNKSSENLKVLKIGIIVGVFMLVITTSSGAIVSVAVSLLALCMCAENKSVRVLATFGILFFLALWFGGMRDVLLGILFPGKSEAGILSAHGRTFIWDMIAVKIAQRPVLGWGYAAVERVLPMYCVDAHNSIVGIRGSLGNVGCGLLIVAMIQLSLYFFKNTNYPGYRGLFVASFCAFVNSNTTNFLAAKASASALTFQFLLILGAAYSVFRQRRTLERS